MTGAMNRTLLARALACGIGLAACAPTAASADVFNFIWSDISGPSDTFQIDTANAPDFTYSENGFFYTVPNGRAIFYDFPNLNFAYRSYNYNGAKLFSGSAYAPQFIPGNYALVGVTMFPGQLGGGSGTLSIARAPAPGGAAPEVGLGLLSLLAAAAALAFTRLRMPLLRRAAI